MKRGLMIGLLCSLALAAVALVGCEGDEATETGEAVSKTYASGALDTDYDGALDVGNQLALGTLKLEQTEHALSLIHI